MDNMRQTVLPVLSLDQNLLETLQSSTYIILYVVLIKIEQS